MLAAQIALDAPERVIGRVLFDEVEDPCAAPAETCGRAQAVHAEHRASFLRRAILLAGTKVARSPGVRPAVIHKRRDGWVVAPNLLDYERERTAFRWDEARRSLSGLPGGHGLNIAHEAVDRHATGSIACSCSRDASRSCTSRASGR